MTSLDTLGIRIPFLFKLFIPVICYDHLKHNSIHVKDPINFKAYHTSCYLALWNTFHGIYKFMPVSYTPLVLTTLNKQQNLWMICSLLKTTK